LDDFGKIVLLIVGSILTVATISVVLSPKSDTPNAIQALGATLGRVITAAVTPIPQPTHAVTAGSGNSGALGVASHANPTDFLSGLFHYPLF
jgi:hypothetical protein